MGINEESNEAMVTAMDTNDPADWARAIELAQQADREDPIPGASN